MLLRSGVIIVFLVLILIIMGLYKYIVKISKDNLNNTLSNNEEIYQIVSAVEEAGFTLEIKEDGSYVLHEKSEK